MKMIKKKQIKVFSDGSINFHYENLISKENIQIKIYNKDYKNFYLNKKNFKPLVDSKHSVIFKKKYF
jgi:hypothetical protein